MCFQPSSAPAASAKQDNNDMSEQQKMLMEKQRKMAALQASISARLTNMPLPGVPPGAPPLPLIPVPTPGM